MQCRYKERLIAAGDMIFGYVSGEFRKAGARRGKFQETSEAQARYNDWVAMNRLKVLIHANFNRFDYVLHLTYNDGCYPESEEVFEKHSRNFIAKLRRLYKKTEKIFKYIIIRAYGEGGRCHLHIIVSGGVPRTALEAAWTYGRTNSDRLQFDECGVIDLSRYLFDQRHAGKRRWSGSRNLIVPPEKTNVTAYGKRDLVELSEAGNPHKFFADRYPGYWLAEFPTIDKNPYNGSYRMTFVLINPYSMNIEWWARKSMYREMGLDDGIIAKLEKAAALQKKKEMLEPEHYEEVKPVALRFNKRSARDPEKTGNSST